MANMWKYRRWVAETPRTEDFHLISYFVFLYRVRCLSLAELRAIRQNWLPVVSLVNSMTLTWII